MGKRAEAETAAVEAPVKKLKKAKADEIEVETEVETEEERRKRKEEKKKRKQAAADASAAAAAVAQRRELERDAERKRRKTGGWATETWEEEWAQPNEEAEKKKQAKQAAAEASAAAAALAQRRQNERDAERKSKRTVAAAEEWEEERPEPNDDATKEAAPVDNSLEVFVGGLPFGVTADTPECIEVLRKYFSKCGDVQRLKVPGNKKKGRGIAFVTYTSKEGVEKALKLNGCDYEGHTMRVNASGEMPPKSDKCLKAEGKLKSDKDKGKGKSKGSGGFKAFVAGLPFNSAEKVIRKDFEECGEIEAFSLPLNAEGNPRGIAFITYKTQEGLDKALAFEGTQYGGRTLTVNKAVDGGIKKGKGKGKEK